MKDKARKKQTKTLVTVKGMENGKAGRRVAVNLTRRDVMKTIRIYQNRIYRLL